MEIGIRFSLLLKVLIYKHCQHVFLPTVASIAKHQSDRPPERLLVDDVFKRLARRRELAQTSSYLLQLPMVPYRIRCILMLAATPRPRDASRCFEENIMTAAAQTSRAFYDHPSAGLRDCLSRFSGSEPLLGSLFQDMACEINHVSAGALWIDTLYHAECSIKNNMTLVHTFSIKPKDIGY
jgi:hypothetical protein